jgi:hypothetical protein
MTEIKNKSNKKMVLIVLTLFLVASLMVGLPSYIWGTYGSYTENQMIVWDMIANTENNLRELYSNSTQLALKQWLTDEPMNFTDGLVWESRLLTFSYERPVYQNATQMIEYGKGACGDFTWVYAAFCVAKDIPFRVIHLGYYVQGVVDHSWVQVNPSHDGKTWIHVDISESCDRIQKGQTINQLWNVTINNNRLYIDSHYPMVLAYQLIDNEVVITDVTSTFS